MTQIRMTNCRFFLHYIPRHCTCWIWLIDDPQQIISWHLSRITNLLCFLVIHPMKLGIILLECSTKRTAHIVTSIDAFIKVPSYYSWWYTQIREDNQLHCPLAVSSDLRQLYDLLFPFTNVTTQSAISLAVLLENYKLSVWWQMSIVRGIITHLQPI